AEDGGAQTQAGLEMHPRGTCAREQARAHERWGHAAPHAAANLDRVSHDATLAGHVRCLPSLAALDEVSVPVVLEEGGLQVPPHQALVEGIVHAGQLFPERPAA